MDSGIYISSDYSRLRATPIQSEYSSMQVPTHRMSETMTEMCRRQNLLSVSRILYLAKEPPIITGKQMSVMLSVSQRTIERDLSALQKSGILKHEGRDNDGVWIIQKMSWH